MCTFSSRKYTRARIINYVYHQSVFVENRREPDEIRVGQAPGACVEKETLKYTFSVYNFSFSF